jgi:isopentenyl diphosphate isomerase/L-lactate dehydrogenase-like FMN-dependent dehydrogenase
MANAVVVEYSHSGMLNMGNPDPPTELDGPYPPRKSSAVNRRSFSKFMAFGAGSLGFCPVVSAGSQGAEARVSKTQSDSATPTDAPNGQGAGLGAKSPQDQGRPLPVNAADFQALAREALPQATYEYITTGSTDEVTLRENVAAFQRLRLLPPLLHGVSAVDTSTTVLKQQLAMPILLAPVGGVSLFYPQGAVAAARAAATARTIIGVSSSAGNSVEEIAKANQGPKWFQLYVPQDRAVARRLVERAEKAGFNAIIVTPDLGERKDADLRNRFVLPRDMLLKHLRDIGFDVADNMSHAELLAFNDRAWDLTLSWKFFDWLRSITKLPLIVKGVLRADDAKKAVSIGLDAIIVSNHGGRRLDGVPASIEQLTQVVKAVGDSAEVYLDSGVRRGTDVLKALALGARAVLIGRPYAWALAASGQDGVERVLELLRDELVSAMLACGCDTVSKIDRSLVVP